MNTHIFSNFEELQESKFISTNEIQVNNQGPTNTQEFVHLGSGKNRYILSLSYDNAICRFSVIDNHIIEWKSKVVYDEVEYEYFKFKAFGVFNDDINCWIQSITHTNSKYFSIFGVKFKLLSIDLQVSDRSSFPITGIKSDYSYCDLVMIPRQEMIRNINNHNIPYDFLEKTNLRDIKLNQQYVFISSSVGGRTLCFVRFNDIEIVENIKDVSYIVEGNANISNDEFIDKNVSIKISYYDNMYTYSHELEYTIHHHIFGDLKRNEISNMYKILD